MESRLIAYVPQSEEVDWSFPVLVEDVVMMGRYGHMNFLRIASKRDRQIVDEALNRVGMTDYRKRQIGELSGGQKKRASLANETVSRPDLLFLDEVTSGLDEQTDLEMMRLFRRRAEEGMTVVCVTHTLANVEECCHKVAILAPGGFLAFLGTPREACAYFGIDRLAAVYALSLIHI